MMKDIITIQEAVNPIAIQYGVKRIYLFGSYAKGKANETSDVDLIIEKGKPMSLLRLAGMRQKIQEALGLPVDLITTTGMDEDFKKEIEGTEILLYEA